MTPCSCCLQVQAAPAQIVACRRDTRLPKILETESVIGAGSSGHVTGLVLTIDACRFPLVDGWQVIAWKAPMRCQRAMLKDCRKDYDAELAYQDAECFKVKESRGEQCAAVKGTVP